MPSIKRRHFALLALGFAGAWVLHRVTKRCDKVDESRIRADFAAGNTVIVNGWMLSRYEADRIARCSG